MARKNAAQKQAQREKLEQLARENPEQHQQKGEQEQEQEPKSKKQMHRKDKPWDVEGTDHWKVEPWNETDMPGPLLEESSFATVSRRLC
jgi:ribosomal RNA assembly protein